MSQGGSWVVSFSLTKWDEKLQRWRWQFNLTKLHRQYAEPAHWWSLQRVSGLCEPGLDVYVDSSTGETLSVTGFGDEPLDDFVRRCDLDVNVVGSPTLWSTLKHPRVSLVQSGWVWYHSDTHKRFPFPSVFHELTVHFEGRDEAVTAVVDWSSPGGNTLERIDGEWEPLEFYSFESLSGTTVAKVDWRFVRFFDKAEEANVTLYRRDLAAFIEK